MTGARIYTAALIVLALVSASAAMAGAPSAMLDATRTVHEDGLVVLHAERTGLPLVKAVLIVRSGAVDEPNDLGGLASLTASLLTDGTGTRSAEAFSEEAGFIGASIGASAGADYTTISLSVLKKDLDKGFELFADALTNPAFLPEELERKREMVIGSLFQSLEDPDYVAWRAFANTVFGTHPYGRNTSGTPESIGQITRADIAGFHKLHFTPANSILAVAGDLDAGELEALLEKYFAAWRGFSTGKGTGPEKPALPAPASPEPQRILNEMDITQANIYFGHLGLNRSHPDYYAVQVMNYAMGGGGFSSRLMDKVRDDMGLAYSIHSTFRPYMDSGVFYVNVQTRNDSAMRVVEVIRSIISDVRDNGITEDELEAAKAYLTGSFPRRISTTGKTARFMALVEYFGLGLDYPEEYISAINALTLEDMREAGRKYLHPDRAVLSITADLEKAGLDNIDHMNQMDQKK